MQGESPGAGDLAQAQKAAARSFKTWSWKLISITLLPGSDPLGVDQFNNSRLPLIDSRQTEKVTPQWTADPMTAILIGPVHAAVRWCLGGVAGDAAEKRTLTKCLMPQASRRGLSCNQVKQNLCGQTLRHECGRLLAPPLQLRSSLRYAAHIIWHCIINLAARAQGTTYCIILCVRISHILQVVLGLACHCRIHGPLLVT